MEKLSTRRSIMGTQTKSKKCTRIHSRIPHQTSGLPTPCSDNAKGPKIQKSNRNWRTQVIVRMGRWKVWTRLFGSIRKSMGKMERLRTYNSRVGRRRRRYQVHEDVNLNRGVMLRTNVSRNTSPMTLYKRTAERPVGYNEEVTWCLMDYSIYVGTFHLYFS